MKRFFSLTVIPLLFVLFMLFIGAGMVFAGAEKAVEIVLWHFGGLDTELKYIPEVVANFVKANPGITVQRTHFPWDARLEKIIVAHRQKSLPDVIMTDSFEVPNMVEMGILTVEPVPIFLEGRKTAVHAYRTFVLDAVFPVFTIASRSAHIAQCSSPSRYRRR